MRYKYRVRLFYSLVFFILGLIAGYLISNYDFTNVDYKIRSLDIKDINLKAYMKSADSDGKIRIGIILPKSESSLKDAISLASMEMNLYGNKTTIFYEEAECSVEDALTAMTRLKENKVNAIYGIFCNESIRQAVDLAEKNMILMISPSVNRETTQSMGNVGIIKTDLYKRPHQNTQRFILAFDKFYKRTPDMYDAISYDAINLMEPLLSNKEIKYYEGTLGTISIKGKAYSYIIVIQ